MKEKRRGIVRLVGTDIDGELQLERGLRRIDGISFTISRSICRKTDLNPNKKIGDLTEAEREKIMSTLDELPGWLKNRTSDKKTDNDRHLIGAEIQLEKREDINAMKRMKSYRGVRHSFGLPVRGQRTRGSFRKGKSMGVSRKKIKQKKEAAKKG